MTGTDMDNKLEVIWCIRGYPADPDAAFVPVTCHDLESRRIRYQRVPRSIGLELDFHNGMAKYSAVWTGNEWSLIDMLPDTAREVA